MDEELKARFRQFSQSWNDDDVVDDESGLTGRDLKAIAAGISRVVSIRAGSFDQLIKDYGDGKLG